MFLSTSYKDVNKRSTKFKYFVLTAEVLPSPTLFSFTLPDTGGVLMLYFILPGMQKVPEFFVDVGDRCRAAVALAADPDVRHRAHQE
jgi:hypothetical protein